MNYPLTIYSKTAQYIDEKAAIELEKLFPQMKFSPFIRNSAIIKSSTNMDGAVVFGVDFAKESEINPIFAEAVKNKSFAPFECVVGSGLKADMEKGDEDKITLIFASAEPGGFGVSPTIKRFTAKNSFHSGLLAYDKSYIYLNIKDFAKVLHTIDGAVDGIHVYSKNPQKDKVVLENALGGNFAVVGFSVDL